MYIVCISFKPLTQDLPSLPALCNALIHCFLPRFLLVIFFVHVLFNFLFSPNNQNNYDCWWILYINSQLQSLTTRFSQIARNSFSANFGFPSTLTLIYQILNVIWWQFALTVQPQTTLDVLDSRINWHPAKKKKQRCILCSCCKIVYIDCHDIYYCFLRNAFFFSFKSEMHHLLNVEPVA